VRAVHLALESPGGAENLRDSPYGDSSARASAQSRSRRQSPVLAFFLTFFFGPIGLLYVKVVPALVLIRGGRHRLLHPRHHSGRGLDRLDRLGLHRSLPQTPRRLSSGALPPQIKGYRFRVTTRQRVGVLPRSGRSSSPPGWYPDKLDATKVRWWDGGQWADDTRPASNSPRRERRQQTRATLRLPARTEVRPAGGLRTPDSDDVSDTPFGRKASLQVPAKHRVVPHNGLR